MSQISGELILLLLLLRPEKVLATQGSVQHKAETSGFDSFKTFGWEVTTSFYFNMGHLLLVNTPIYERKFTMSIGA